MKQKLILLIPIIAFTICSCGVTQLDPKALSDPENASKLFSDAENFYRSNSYENALKAYQEFLDSHSSDSKAKIALMRIATIYSNQKKYNRSLMTYQRLIAEYPHSELALDSMIEIMMLFFHEKKFREVILQASNIIQSTDLKPYLHLAYEVLGDTYMSLKSPKEAIFFYQMAGLECEETIPLKLKAAANQLTKDDMLSLSTELNDQFLKGYFLFELGVYQIQNENFKEALHSFLEFKANFPQHEKIGEAQDFIEGIHEKLAFKRRLIGCLLPLTGPYKTFGNRALKGIQFAQDQFNNQSNQPEFEIIFRDTRSDPDTAINAIKQFDEDRVSIIIGPIVTSEYAAQEAQIRGIPIITLTQKPGIPDLGEYVFRIFLTPQMQIDTLLPYVVNQLGIKRFAVLYPEEIYGNTFLRLFRDGVLNYGATLVAVESYKPEQTDFASQIRKLSGTWEQYKNSCPISKKHKTIRNIRHKKNEMALDFDAIFIPDSADKIALIAPQLVFYDIDNILLMGTNLWHSDKLIDSARDYVQEALITDAFYAEDSKKNVREFITDFEKLHGHNPGFIEALAYDTAMINFYCLSDLGIRSRSDLKERLQNLIEFEGVTGYTSFKKNGDVIKRLYLLQIEDNQFVQLNGD